METVMGKDNVVKAEHLNLAGEFLEHMASFPGATVRLNDGKLKLTPDGGVILSAEFRLDSLPFAGKGRSYRQ